MPYLDTHPAANTPESAITEPTDKSIPPSMITIVIPHARSIFVDICLSTLKTFFAVGNELLVAGNTVRNIASTSNAIMIPIFSLKKFNAFKLFAFFTFYLHHIAANAIILSCDISS